MKRFALIIICLVAALAVWRARSGREPASIAGGLAGFNSPGVPLGTPTSTGASSAEIAEAPSAGAAGRSGPAVGAPANVSADEVQSESLARGLARLQSASSVLWQTRADQEGRLRTLSGGAGLKLVGADETSRARAFLGAYAQDLFGVSAEDLHQVRAEATDRERFVFERRVRDLPVVGATVTLFFQAGELTRVQSDLATGARTSELSTLSRDAALGALVARERGEPLVALGPAEQVLYPHQGRLLLSYRAHFAKGDRESFDILVDATSGREIRRRSLIAH